MGKSAANINSFTGEQLYRHVKAGFIVKGTSLAAWCRENRVNPTNARAALMGSWSGPSAKSLCVKLLRASGTDLHQHHAA